MMVHSVSRAVEEVNESNRDSRDWRKCATSTDRAHTSRESRSLCLSCARIVMLRMHNSG